MNIRQSTGSLMLLISAILGAVGCGGGGSSIAPSGGTSLAIISTSPIAGTTSIPTSQKITAVFNNQLNPATVSTLTVKASTATGPISGTVTCVNQTVSFQPSVVLPANTLISATILNAVKDQSGNSLGSNYVWSFTTGSTVDTTPPTVTSENPPGGSVGVGINTKLTVYFSKPMAASTVNTTTFKVVGPKGPISGSVTSLNNVAVFTPAVNFDNSVQITATVTTGMTDLSGNALQADRAWSFVTGTTVDANPPKVSSTDPAGGATGVPTNKKITVIFSKSMAPDSLTTSTIKVQGPLGTIAGVVTAADNVAEFTPTSSFDNSVQITVTVTTGAKDISGNALAADWKWSFITAASVDSTPPTVVLVDPIASALGVPTNYNVSATFSKVMDTTTLTTASFNLKQPSGTVVPATLSYSGKVAVLNPISVLAANTVYTATISTGIADTSGNHLASLKSWSFTTAATTDTTPPTVISTNPVDKATNVVLNKSINATFSEGMQAQTINGSTFSVYGVAGTVTYDSLTRIATFTPSANLAANTTYTANMEVGVKDIAGNNLALRKSWTFTTGVQLAQTNINLGAATTYAVLAGSTITNAGPTILNGDVGVSPGTAVVGFPPGTINGGLHAGDAVAAKAKSDLLNGALDAAGRLGAVTLPGDLSGLTFTPGLYKNSTSVMLSTGNVTLDAQGDPNAVFIFQMGSTLTTSPGTQVVLAGGAQAGNIYWSVGTSATLGVNSIFKGIVLAQASITINTGATNDGCLLTNIGAVTLQSNAVTRPARKH